jgi:hypothetical protein
MTPEVGVVLVIDIEDTLPDNDLFSPEPGGGPPPGLHREDGDRY